MNERQTERWALNELGDALVSAEASAPRRTPSGRIAIGAVAAVLAFTGFITLTPPGRAVAESVAELVGIGDEPTVSHGENGGKNLVATNHEIVVATGTTPSGERLEVSAFQGVPSAAVQEQHERRIEGLPANMAEEMANDPLIRSLGSEDGTCFVLDFPDARDPFGDSQCSMNGIDIPMTNPVFNTARHAQPQSEVSMGAMTGPTVESIQITYENEAGERVEQPVIFGHLSEEMAGRIGAPHPMGMYVAYLPADLFPKYMAPAMGTLEITAYDGGGEVVERLDYGPVFERSRERHLESLCLQRAVEPYAENGELVPLARIRRDCER